MNGVCVVGEQYRLHNAVQRRTDRRVEVYTCREEPHAAAGPSTRYIQTCDEHYTLLIVFYSVF